MKDPEFACAEGVHPSARSFPLILLITRTSETTIAVVKPSK